MSFDLESLKLAFGTATAAFTTLKQVIDFLPKGSKKDEVDAALRTAERQLKLAESQAAQGLEYELCRNHPFPPVPMLSRDDQHWKCPECGNDKYTGPAGMGYDGNDGLRRKSYWSIS